MKFRNWISRDYFVHFRITTRMSRAKKNKYNNKKPNSCLGYVDHTLAAFYNE